MKALFLARFQPFHKGHLHAIKTAMKNFDEVIVAIGSSNKKNTLENPFSFEERKKMVNACLKKIKVIDVEDMEKDEDWVKNILKKVDFDVIISGSNWIKKCFSGVKDVENSNLLIPELYNGTKIRENIIKGEEWEDLVPKEVVRFIKEVNGEKRIRDLAEKEID